MELSKLGVLLQFCVYFANFVLISANSDSFSNPQEVLESCAVPGANNKFGARIRGPELNVKIRQFPFMASYGYLQAPYLTNWNNLCAASVLSKRTLMTAAHCLRNHYSFKHPYQVLLGQSNLNSDIYASNRQQMNISKVELHPKYDNVSSYYDIGLIYTDKDINFNADVMPICLSNQPNSDVNFLASKSVHMAGWGRVTDQSNARRIELTLRQITMTVFDQDYCNDRYDITGKSPHAQSRQTFLPKMFSKATFCAGNVVQDIGSCKGDSGTPLIEYISSTRPAVMVARGVLHGCIGACCSANYPSVFANLGEKEIWNFVQGKAIKINIDKEAENDVDQRPKSNNQLVIENDNETTSNSRSFVIGIVFVVVAVLLGLICLFYIKFYRQRNILSRI